MLGDDRVGKRKRKYTKKQVYIQALKTFFWVFIVFIVSYAIFETNLLNPSIDKTTANYISFNTTNSTDMLKVSNLEKMSTKNGKSNRNLASLDITISGNLGDYYQIVLYPLGNVVEDEFVRFSLSNLSIEENGILSEMEDSIDGGKVIYNGKIKKNNFWNIKMWIDKSYKKNVNNVSYEIRIVS